jgi:predicted ATPase/DNA-binding SARP family transcriptional activator
MDVLLLGPFEVRREGRRVELAGPKQRALLAMLALHANESVSAERLAMAVWGEEVPNVNAVRVQISRLRAALGDPDLLVTTPSGYMLRAEPDTVRFERLCREGAYAEALELWRGPALAEFDFAQAERARLDELHAGALEAHIDQELANGRHRELIGELEQRTQEHPLRERTYAQLMLALARSGRQADALAVYHRARATLVEELGIEPGDELRALERQVLTQTVTPAASTIPAPPTPTIGREHDLERLQALLETHRLVTIVGPGGVGKTRLAIELARRRPDATFVSLAGVAKAEDVPEAIVRARGVTPMPGESAIGALTRQVARGSVLMVLDNCEHVLEAAALIPPLLEAAPELRILATSREASRLQAERVFRLAPLELSAAVDQFTSLVEARDLDASDRAAAAEICRRVDGLPLALELAAGRLGLLTVPELAVRLRDGLDAIGSGPRDTPPRQRTLTAMIEWSYALLGPAEQRALCALGVFAGGGTLEAAEAVTQAPLDVLQALVEKHLAVARDGRLLLLETVREFALAHLTDEEAVRRRHAEHYAALAEAALVHLEWTFEAALHDREASNFRAALRWTIESGEAELALRLAAKLNQYWGMRELGPEGERWLRTALALDAPGVPPELRADALEALAYRLSAMGRVEEAESAGRASLALREGPAGRASSLCALAYLRLHLHQVELAYELACEAEAVAPDERLRVRALEVKAMMAPTLDEALASGAEAAAARRRAGGTLSVARLQASLAYTALYHDAPATAAQLCAEALALSDDPFVTALIHGNAGLAALFMGDVRTAEDVFRRQWAVIERHGHEQLRFEALSGLAAVAALDGRDELAARLTGAARASSHDWHDPLIDARLEARCFAPARARLGEAAWAREERIGAQADPLSLL